MGINLSFRYVEEHIQKTGVAIETQGFTFITSGRKRESLTVSTSTCSPEMLLLQAAQDALHSSLYVARKWLFALLAHIFICLV